MADQPDFSGSAMIALYPPRALAEQLHLDGGLDVDELHCTVAYLGDAATVDLDKALTAVEALADRAPIRATIGGHGRFTGADQDVLIGLVDAPALEQLRRDVVDALTTLGILIPADHGYTSHITLQYLAPGDSSPIDRLDATRCEFGALVLVHGDDRHEFPFRRPDIGPYAAEAFAAGWAATRGPLGRYESRYKIASGVAVAMARTHPDSRSVLETTLRLGSLEGTWAELYDRREQLYTTHTAAVMAAWRDLVGHLDVPAAVRDYRDTLGLTETDREDADRAHRKAIAAAAAAKLLEYLATLGVDTPAYTATVTALADALHTAEAEGVAGGYAIASQQVGVVAIDFDIAFKDAYEALRDLDAYWGQAKGWLAEILRGTAADLGRTLARLAEEGADYREMVDEAEWIVGSGDVRAVETLVDLAMGQSFSRGAISLYLREGAKTGDYVTAGGARVCKICLDLEAKNPWPLLEIPPPPRHPFCRCVIMPADPLEALDVTRYLPTGGAA